MGVCMHVHMCVHICTLGVGDYVCSCEYTCMYMYKCGGACACVYVWMHEFVYV